MTVTLNIYDSKGPETNETDKNAMGGTEIMKYGLYDRLDSIMYASPFLYAFLLIVDYVS